MYIFIFEDGTIKKVAECGPGDFDSVESGCLEIIDITNYLNPVYYLGNGKWEDLEPA